MFCLLRSRSERGPSVRHMRCRIEALCLSIRCVCHLTRCACVCWHGCRKILQPRSGESIVSFGLDLRHDPTIVWHCLTAIDARPRSGLAVQAKSQFIQHVTDDLSDGGLKACSGSCQVLAFVFDIMMSIIYQAYRPQFRTDPAMCSCLTPACDNSSA